AGPWERTVPMELENTFASWVKLSDWQNECVKNPSIGRTNILPLVLQGRPELQAARREHSGVIDRVLKQSAKRSGHELNSPRDHVFRQLAKTFGVNRPFNCVLRDWRSAWSSDNARPQNTDSL